jgi:NAD(P)-dependent dehydrogenase (short-subunit alcohol dehydrogenase family)
MSPGTPARVAFITGGTGGIGFACAQRLAADGTAVMVADLDAQAVANAVDGLRRAGSTAAGTVLDVRDEESVRAAVDSAIDTFGRLDVAVNAAGIGGSPVRLHEYPLADWSAVLAVNLVGLVACMQVEISHMLAAGSGSVVNISSVLGLTGHPLASAYVAAKHGVEGVTKAAALEYARDGIRVNSVAPGFIATSLLKERRGPDELQAIGDQHPVRRLGEPAEVAEVVAFLAAENSAFVTGSCYRVDGGYLSASGGQAG